MQKIGSPLDQSYNPFLAMWTTIVRQPRGSDAPRIPSESHPRAGDTAFTRSTRVLTFEETRKARSNPASSPTSSSSTATF